MKHRNQKTVWHHRQVTRLLAGGLALLLTLSSVGSNTSYVFATDTASANAIPESTTSLITEDVEALTADSSSTSYDLGSYITEIVIKESNDGGSTYVTLEDGATVVTGALLRINLKYTISSGIIDDTNNTVTYTLPATLKIASDEVGVVTATVNVNGNTTTVAVGTYTIDTSGNVTIVYYTTEELESKYSGDTLTAVKAAFTAADGFQGTLTFDCTASNDSNSEAASISFSGVGDTISITNVSIEADTSVETGDMSVKKSASTPVASAGGSTYTVTYTITVTSTNGTGDTITLVDTLGYWYGSAATWMDYDTDSVVVKKGSTTIDSGSYSLSFKNDSSDPSNESMTISGLPALEAGESYTITYTCTYDAASYLASSGSTTLYNSVSATVANHPKLSTSASATTTVTHDMVSKESSSNGSSVTFTITINSENENLNGYTLADVLTLSGASSSSAYSISDLSVSVKGTTTGTDNSSSIQSALNSSFTTGYTFSSDDYNTYTITYTVTSTDALHSSYINLTNKATLSNNNYTYTAYAYGYINPSDALSKTCTDSSGPDSNGIATVTWTTTVKEAISSTETVSISDTFGDNVYMSSGNTITVPSSLYGTYTFTVSGTSSTTFTVTISADGATVSDTGNSYATVSDATSGVYTITIGNGITTENPITGFSFSPTGTEADSTTTYSIPASTTITYTTYVDTSAQSKGATKYYYNTAKLTVGELSESDTASYSYKKPIETIQKYVFTNYSYVWTSGTDSNNTSSWSKTGFASGTTSTDSNGDTVTDAISPISYSDIETLEATALSAYNYTISGVNSQITDFSDGTYLYYMIVVDASSAGDTITITDVLPSGMTYAAAVLCNYNSSWPSMIAKEGESGSALYVSTTSSDDESGTTTVTFVITPSQASSLSEYAIVYAVKVADESDLVNENAASATGVTNAYDYTNTAYVGDTTSTDSASVTLPIVAKSSSPSDNVITKTGVQHEIDYNDDGTNDAYETEVEYTVYINPNAEKKDSDKDSILSLTDTMKVGSTGLVSVNITSFTVYAVSEEDGEITTVRTLTNAEAGYTFAASTTETDDGYTYYDMTINVPNNTYLMVVYTVNYNYSSDSGGTRYITNTVTLEGEEYSDEALVVYHVSSSSATANGADSAVTVYKVDSENYNQYLDGAVFKLYKYVVSGEGEGSSGWQQVTSTDTTYTINGSTTFTTYSDGEHTEGSTGTNTVYVLSNTLYKLVEVTAPTGYELNKSGNGTDTSANEAANTYYLAFASTTDGDNDSETTLKSAISSALSGASVNEDDVNYYTAATGNTLIIANALAATDSSATLILTKTIDGDYSLSDWDTLAKTLSFTVAKTDDTTATYSISGTSTGWTLITDGTTSYYAYTMTVPAGTYSVTETTTDISGYETTTSYTVTTKTSGGTTVTSANTTTATESVTYAAANYASGTVTTSEGEGTSADVTGIIIAAGDTITVDYTNSYDEQLGQIVITKTIATGDSGTTLSIDDLGNSYVTISSVESNGFADQMIYLTSQNFTDEDGDGVYTITIDNVPAGTYVITEVAVALTGYTCSSSYTITVKDTSSGTSSDVTSSSIYTVSESEVSTTTGSSSGFGAVSSDDSTSGATVATTDGITLGDDYVITVELTNTYTPQVGDLIIQKTITGDITDWDSVKDNLTFTISSDSTTVADMVFNGGHDLVITGAATSMTAGESNATNSGNTYTAVYSTSGWTQTSTTSEGETPASVTYTYTIQDVPVGTYSVKETSTQEGYTISTTVTNSSDSSSITSTPTNGISGTVTLAATEGEEDPAYSGTISITNTYTTLVGALSVTKLGDGNATSTSDAFSFLITLTSDTDFAGSYSYTIVSTTDNGADSAASTSGTLTLGTSSSSAQTGNTDSSFSSLSYSCSDTVSGTTYTASITVSLTIGQTITIVGLPIWVDFTISEEQGSGVTGYTQYQVTGDAYTTISEDSSLTEGYQQVATGTITAGVTATSTFTNHKGNGTLTISKTVLDADGNESNDTTTGFSFVVTLSDIDSSDLPTTYNLYDSSTDQGDSNPSSQSVTFSETGDGSGTYTATISIAGKHSITLDLPEGASYSVHELDYSSSDGSGYSDVQESSGTTTYYTTTVTQREGVTDDSSTGYQVGTISAGDADKVGYTNTALATETEATGSLIISKALAGNDIEDYTDVDFLFVITLTEVTGTDDDSSVTITADDTSKVTGSTTATYTYTKTGTSSEETEETEDPYYAGLSTSTSTNYASSSGSIVFTQDSDGTYKAYVWLKAGDTLTISGLPAGIKYLVAEDSTQLSSMGFSDPTYTYQHDNYTGTIQDGGAKTVSFVNNRNTTGDLTIKKVLAGNAYSTDDTFTFTVTLDDTSISGSYTASWSKEGGTTTSGTVTFTQGVATVRLYGTTGYSSVTIQGLPTGTGYTVTETDSGYDSTTVQTDTTTSKVVGDNGVLADASESDSTTGTATTSSSTTSTITAYTEDTVTFTNEKNTYGYLRLSKSTVNIDSSTSFSFTITLDMGDASEDIISDFIAAAALTSTTSSINSGTGNTITKNYTTTSSDYSSGISWSQTTGTNILTATVTLKGGEYLLLQGIYAGATYTVVETTTGYTTTVAVDNGTATSTKTASGTITADTISYVDYTNTDTSNTLTLTKRYSSNGTQLSYDSLTTYASFTLVNASGTDYSSYIDSDSDSTGTYTIANLPAGTYTLTENSLTGFTTSNVKVVFTVSSTGAMSIAASYGATATVSGSNQIAITVTNQRLANSLSLTKTYVDADGNEVAYSDVSSYAEFSLYEVVNGAESTEAISGFNSTGTTSGTYTGVYSISYLEPGDYILRETSTPDGYVALEDIAFTVGEDMKITVTSTGATTGDVGTSYVTVTGDGTLHLTLAAVNEPTNVFRIYKNFYDADGRLLSGETTSFTIQKVEISEDSGDEGEDGSQSSSFDTSKSILENLEDSNITLVDAGVSFTVSGNYYTVTGLNDGLYIVTEEASDLYETPYDNFYLYIEVENGVIKNVGTFNNDGSITIIKNSDADDDDDADADDEVEAEVEAEEDDTSDDTGSVTYQQVTGESQKEMVDSSNSSSIQISSDGTTALVYVDNYRKAEANEFVLTKKYTDAEGKEITATSDASTYQTLLDSTQFLILDLATFDNYIAGASVTDTPTDTGVTSFVYDATQGVYTVNGLEPGTYVIAEYETPDGFITAGDITLTVGDDYKITASYGGSSDDFTITGSTNGHYQVTCQIYNRQQQETSTTTPTSSTTTAEATVTTSTPITVDTGDHTPVAGLLFTMVAALTGFAGCMVGYRRRRRG